MEWINSWFAAPSNLQTSGPISRETLVEFFAKGRCDLFESDSFKTHLRLGHERGKDVQELINTAQEQLFESLGVKGQYGINFMSKIRTAYSNDAEMLRAFYGFVQLEEQALDEAELPASEYKQKYDQVEAMAAKIKASEEALVGLSRQERDRHVATMMQQMVETTTGAKPRPGPPCCSSHQQHAGRACDSGPQQPLAVGPQQQIVDHGDVMGGGGGAGTNMSSEEQMLFFQSLMKAPIPPK